MTRAIIIVACTALLPCGAAAQSIRAPGARTPDQQKKIAPQVPRKAPRPDPSRVWFRIDGGYDPSSRRFTHTLRLPVNVEEASYENEYRVRSGGSFSAAGSVRVWRGWRIGGAVSRASRSSAVDIDAQVPHPFFFEQFRAFSGSASDTRDETAIHVNLGTTFSLRRNILLLAFAGPTVFQVRQGIVSAVAHADEYPYDTATFRSAQFTTEDGSGIGGHAGADLAYYLTRNIGLGASVTFSAGSVPLSTRSGRIRVDAGGFNGGAGLRLRF